jgi:hypothetical protein
MPTRLPATTAAVFTRVPRYGGMGRVLSGETRNPAAEQTVDRRAAL